MASIQSNAQKLIGKITDQDKKPLPYSSIYKVDSWIGATSNKDGYYSLNLEEGRHIIEFRLIGYKTKRDTIYIRSKRRMKLLSARRRLLSERRRLLSARRRNIVRRRVRKLLSPQFRIVFTPI